MHVAPFPGVNSVLTRLRYAFPVFLTVLATACGRDARDSRESDVATQPPAQSAADFVREFYAWYAPYATENWSGSAMFAAMSRDPPILDDRLLALLRADSAAKAAATSEGMGLDFDPFLATQDPCEVFEIGNVTADANAGRIEVRTSCYYVDSLPDVVARVARRGNGWVFTNFEYPREKTDLLKVLK